MRISEVYVSIQGEAAYAGEPTVFVRLTGCNLRCWYCDSPHTSWNPEGANQNWQEVLRTVLAFDVHHVDLTGGEPLLQPEIVPLSAALREAGRFVTVETAGTLFRPVAADLMSVSPKRPNSNPKGTPWETRHEAWRDVPEVIDALVSRYDCQFKFVIDQPEDLHDVGEYLSRHPAIVPEQVWLMPQAIDPGVLKEKSEWIRPIADRAGWRFSPRLHIERYGNARGT